MFKSSDARALGHILEEMKKRVAYKHGFSFGESGLNLTKDGKKDLVANMSELIFTNEINRAKGESTVTSNTGIGRAISLKMLENMKNELEERGKLIFSPKGEQYALGSPIPSQQFGLYGSFLPQGNQLLLIALAPSVIKPIYNKVMKSIVLKGLSMERIVDVPYIINTKGEKINFYEALNNPKVLLEFSNGGQPTARVKVDFKDGKVQTNLIKLYNAEGMKNDPTNFRAIKSTTDFIAKGVAIVGYGYGETNTTEVNSEIWRSSGYNAQAGEISDTVASINLALTNKAGKVTNVLGNLRANGDLYVVNDSPASNADTLKSLTFEFFIPAKGAMDPIKTVPRKSNISYFIKKHVTGMTTVNPQFLDDGQFILGKDLVAQFNEDIVELANAKIDGEVLNKLDELVQHGANKASYADKNLVNNDSALYQNAKFAYANVDMSLENYGYTDRISGHSIVLAQRMFEVMNTIDRTLNPNEKNFSIVSDSLASRWLTNQDGKTSNEFNYIGEGLGEVAGITIPYNVKAVCVGGSYYGSYVVTNKLEPMNAKGTITNTGGEKVEARANKHRFYINPRFEENLDTNILAHGFERVYQGTNDNEYVHDLTLNYEKRYDIFTFNQTIGAVDFTDLPGFSAETVTKRI